MTMTISLGRGRCGAKRSYLDVKISTVLWDVAPCRWVRRCQRFGGKRCICFQGGRVLYPENYGSMFLRNVGTYVPDYSASRQSSESPP